SHDLVLAWTAYPGGCWYTRARLHALSIATRSPPPPPRRKSKVRRFSAYLREGARTTFGPAFASRTPRRRCQPASGTHGRGGHFPRGSAQSAAIRNRRGATARSLTPRAGNGSLIVSVHRVWLSCAVLTRQT